VVTRIPSVVVPVCVVSRCVYTSVAKCVLQRAHSMGARACVRATACVTETPCVDETPCVPKCVLPSTPYVSEGVCVTEAPCMSEAPCASGTTCVNERVRVSEARCVRETACVRKLCVREMTVGMWEHAAVSPGVSVLEWCMSVVTRGSLSAWVEWRRRLRQRRDKGRVTAIVISSTAPGLHGGEREVRAVQRTRLFYLLPCALHYCLAGEYVCYNKCPCVKCIPFVASYSPIGNAILHRGIISWVLSTR